MAIDLTSGVPLDDTSLIQQIPLGGQVFPFTDWDAAARPKRNPIYGDDILPTSALVAGQLPDRTAPQSVHTDGKHALLVKDVGGGSGGYAANAAPYLNGSLTRTGPLYTGLVAGGDSPITWLNPCGRYIYGWSRYLILNTTNVTNFLECGHFITTSDETWLFAMGELSIFFDSAKPYQTIVNETISLANPIDVLASQPTYDGTLGVYFSVNASHMDGFTAVTLFTGN